MAKHILLSKATRRPYSEAPLLPPKAIYEIAAGFWTLDEKPFVSSATHLGRTIVTKKCDQETGEDQKGE